MKIEKWQIMNPPIRKLCWIVWSSSDVFSPGETVSIPSRPKHPNRTPLSQPRSPQSSMTQLSQQQNSVATGPPNPSPPKLSWGPPPRPWSERIFPRTGSNYQPPTSLAENLAGQPNNMLHQPFSPNNQPTLPSLLPSQMCAAPPLTDINPTLPPSHTPTASRCLPHQVTPPIPVATQPSP